MASVELDDHEWSWVMTVLANQNPILMKIAEQLRIQGEERMRQAAAARAKGNSAAHPDEF